VADELPSPSTIPAPDYRRRTPQPTVTRRERPRSPYVPGSTVKRPRLEPAPRGTYKPPPKPVYKYKPKPKPKAVLRKPIPKPKPLAYQRRAANELLKRAGKSAASWVPKILLLGRYANPFYDVGELLVRTVLGNSKLARQREYADLDAAAWRTLNRAAHPQHAVTRDQRVKPYHAPRPISQNPVLQKNPGVKSEKFEVSSQVFARTSEVLTPARAPAGGSRPSTPLPKSPQSSPKLSNNFAKNLFQNQFPQFKTNLLTSTLTKPAAQPQLALAPKFDLTPINARGVRSSAVRSQPLGQKPGCKCPATKKDKKLRSGRGFFVVSPSGLERRKYWKTGKNHTKEYRNARNTSRDFRRSGRKQLQSVLGFGV